MLLAAAAAAELFLKNICFAFVLTFLGANRAGRWMLRVCLARTTRTVSARVSSKAELTSYKRQLKNEKETIGVQSRFSKLCKFKHLRMTFRPKLGASGPKSEANSFL